MKEIPLTQNKTALVDDANYEWLNQFKWYAHKDHGSYYARCSINSSCLLMHREIMGLSLKDGKQLDHIDNNGLNNQRSNLRICTTRQNQFNRKPVKGATSQFKGVTWHLRDKKWYVQIGYNGKNNYLGVSDNEVQAAKMYDRAAIKYFGEFAYLNFPTERRA